MTELERALVALGNELDFPPSPRSRAGGACEARAAIAVCPALVFAVALLVIAFGIAMAVPPARSAILRFFHIGSITIEAGRDASAGGRAAARGRLGPALSRQAAERRAQLTMQLPHFEGPSRPATTLIQA